MIKYIKPISFIALAVLSLNCGGGSSENAASEQNTIVKEAVKSNEYVSPESGGPGFENVAESLGFDTYHFTEEDLRFFGNPNAVKGGTLTHLTSRFPATLRVVGQHYNYAENMKIISPLCYESLISTHPLNLSFIPELATHWKISEDKMEYWFRINPDARFSDGEEITAEDVIATWDLHMDETILMPSDQLVFGKFERPVAESKYIVRVKSKVLNWRNLLYFGGMNILPHHILKDLDGTDFLKKFQYKLIPGSGAYTIHDKDVINQESFTLTRRTDYWAKELPTRKNLYNFDRIKNIVVKDNIPLMYEKFKKGECDFFTVSQARVWVEETDIPSVEKGWIQKRKVYSERPAGTSGYAFNMRKWPFDDKRVRYAFAYLYNREKMNKEMYYSEYSMMNSMFSGSVYENPNNEFVKYNPEKAVQLLNEAGYTSRNDDGWLVHDKTGKLLRFEIAIQKGSAYMVTPVQQMMKDYGIDMQIKFMDGNSMWKNLMERNFTVYMQNWGGLVFPNPETSLNSELADKNNNNNISGFKNARVDELLDIYDKEFDQQKRVEIIREIDGIYSEIHPAAWGIARNYQRIMYWNKFGMPEHMVTRYEGNENDIFAYWYIDPEKDKALNSARKNDSNLPVGETDFMFWPDYLKSQPIQ